MQCALSRPHPGGAWMPLPSAKHPGYYQLLNTLRLPRTSENSPSIASTAEGNGAPQGLVQQIRSASRERFNGPEEVLQEIRGR